MDPKLGPDKSQVSDLLKPDAGAKLVELVKRDMERAKREREAKDENKKRSEKKRAGE